jgi:hypothetical protein
MLMNNLLIGTTVLIFIGGAIYFWQRARIFGFGVPTLIIAYLFFPVASIVGLYWFIKDIYIFYKK